MEGERASEQAAAVVPEHEPECLGQSGRSPGHEPRVRLPRQPAKPPHRVEPLQWLRRPKQHRRGLSRRPADDVHARMEPVDPVRVESPGRPEHRAIAWGGAAMGVGGRIASVAEVRLDLHQADHQAFARGQPVDQSTPDQVGSDQPAIPGVEASAQRGVERHGRQYRTAATRRATRSGARRERLSGHSVGPMALEGRRGSQGPIGCARVPG